MLSLLILTLFSIYCILIGTLIVLETCDFTYLPMANIYSQFSYSKNLMPCLYVIISTVRKVGIGLSKVITLNTARITMPGQYREEETDPFSSEQVQWPFAKTVLCDFTLMNTFFCTLLDYPRKCKLSFKCGSWVTVLYWLMFLSLLQVIFKSNSQKFLCLYTWHLCFYAVEIPPHKDILGWKWFFWGFAIKEALVFTFVW